ncbi:hypothetical protein ACFY5H_13940 [Streptomyces sp. NPDC013012]|uniref:hypothetical protein n=1 Tax=Streptomyces sp. NPDC013012 TaxID=3364860 RepID=UPI00369970B4
MTQFVSSVWGTTARGTNTAGYAWGHKPPTGAGTSLPVLGVLGTTARVPAQAVRTCAKAAEKVRTEPQEIPRG